MDPTDCDRRLIVYGSLAPGGSNHHVVAELSGRWRRGWIRGELIELGEGAAKGYPAVRPDPRGPRVPAHLLESSDLPAHWDRLDVFEGGDYQRVTAPFHGEEDETTGPVLGQVYALRPSGSPHRRAARDAQARPSGARVRALGPDDGEAYTALRRAMLRDEPLAFGASPDMDVAREVSAVRERLSGAPESVVLGAFSPELGGAIGLYRLPNPKRRHRVEVWGMYVVPELRGSGLGRLLLEAGLEHARSLPGARQVNLSVSSAAEAARALYESAGFEVWGSEPRSMVVEGVELTEHHMVLLLDA